MNFTKADMAIIISMSIALVTMTFAFPAAGMVDEESANATDIPEFDIETSRFDFAGEFPRNPGQPSVGTLVYDNTTSALEDSRQIWLNGDTDSGTEMLLLDDNDETNASVRLNYWPGPSTDEVILTEVGEFDQIKNDSAGWEVTFEFVSAENRGEDNVTLTVDYTIEQQPEDTSWFDRVPILGGVVGAGEQLAGIVGWIGSVLFWLFGTLFEVALNLVGILFDIMVFVIDTGTWLATTWAAITAGAGSWAAVFVAIPGLLLFLELAKLVMIGISLLPTT